jgi:hypothetical protein
MTYVEWVEKPEHTTHATVSKPSEDPEALTKQSAGERQENEYSPDEQMTNIRLAGARRRRI